MSMFFLCAQDKCNLISSVPTFWETYPDDKDKSIGFCFMPDSIIYEYWYSYDDHLRYITYECATIGVTKEKCNIIGDTIFMVAFQKDGYKEDIYVINAYKILECSEDKLTMIKLLRYRNKWVDITINPIRIGDVPEVRYLKRCRECTEPRGNLWLLR